MFDVIKHLNEQFTFLSKHQRKLMQQFKEIELEKERIVDMIDQYQRVNKNTKTITDNGIERKVEIIETWSDNKIK